MARAEAASAPVSPSAAALGPASTIHIEVAYSPGAGAVDRVVLRLAAGSTVGHALVASGLLHRHSLGDVLSQSLGVWGRSCTADASLRDGDRIEIYRELRVDPKEARRERYSAQKPKPGLKR